MKYLLKRILAYLIDCTLCYAVIMLIIQWLILSNTREIIGITDEWFENSWNMQLYVLLTISLPAWLYFTYLDSNRSRGSYGKRIMKMAVRNMEDQSISPGRSFVRTILKLLPWEISHIGIIFPIPIYFAEDPNIRILTIAGMILFVIYFVTIAFSRTRLAPYDKILGTQVIETKENTI